MNSADQTETTISAFRAEYERYQRLADLALADLSDEAFFQQPGKVSNSPALIVKHLTGNFRSRWTNFLTTDGDKPDRNRDGEFVLSVTDTRENLMAAWADAWRILYRSLAELTDGDLSLVVHIREVPHTVALALARNLSHTSYHVGQLTYLARLFAPESQWHTIPLNVSPNLRVDPRP